ncbi:MAG: hypothetical protein Q4C60_02040 [Eubacteriales bacterium]|nr:hypothetical protein [Eubacteriales bacterium]
MGLYAEIPGDQEKRKRVIEALEWQLKQEIPAKDREIFQQILKAYRAAGEKESAARLVEIEYGSEKGETVKDT